MLMLFLRIFYGIILSIYFLTIYSDTYSIDITIPIELLYCLYIIYVFVVLILLTMYYEVRSSTYLESIAPLDLSLYVIIISVLTIINFDMFYICLLATAALHFLTGFIHLAFIEKRYV